jgi:hypothetical protein
MLSCIEILESCIEVLCYVVLYRRFVSCCLVVEVFCYVFQHRSFVLCRVIGVSCYVVQHRSFVLRCAI